MFLFFVYSASESAAAVAAAVTRSVKENFGWVKMNERPVSGIYKNWFRACIAVVFDADGPEE